MGDVRRDDGFEIDQGVCQTEGALCLAIVRDEHMVLSERAVHEIIERHGFQKLLEDGGGGTGRGYMLEGQWSTGRCVIHKGSHIPAKRQSANNTGPRPVMIQD